MVSSVASVEPPPLAVDVFGGQLDLAVRYVEWLTTAGVQRGLVGPREVERIWERHVLNCVGASAVIPPEASVIDVGSGAGLPGVVLAIARPDLDVTLIESMLRRTTFLSEVVADLGLSRVSVRRNRAEELRSTGLSADVVTARAVAPMDRLVGWAAPLLAEHGELVALKGSSAVDEVAGAMPALRRARLDEGRLIAVVPGTGDSGALQHGLVACEQGRWNLGPPTAAFVPGVDAILTGAQEISEEDRVALVLVFRRSAKSLSGQRSGGLG